MGEFQGNDLELHGTFHACYARAFLVPSIDHHALLSSSFPPARPAALLRSLHPSIPPSHSTYIELRNVLLQLQPDQVPDDGKCDEAQEHATGHPGAVGLRGGRKEGGRGG